MDFRYVETIDYPRDEVYAVLRDRLVEVVPYLPEVEYIEVESREDEQPGRVRFVNLWQANAKAAPKIARPFLSKKMTRWRDHALWNDEKHCVEWKFESFYFDRLYDCSGVNIFHALDDNRTQLELTGSLVVYADRIRGVPKILARKAVPKIEQYLVETVTPNLAQLPRAVQSFLDEKKNG